MLLEKPLLAVPAFAACKPQNIPPHRWRACGAGPCGQRAKRREEILQSGRNDATVKQEGDGFVWWCFAIGSAVFAALTSILAKIGIEGVNSTLATAIRTAVVLVMSWGMVFFTGTQSGIGEISHRSWLFLILSGLATGASWLCYYHALQTGAASKVVPIDKMSVVITLVLAFLILREPFSAKSLIGCVLITAGTLLMVL